MTNTTLVQLNEYLKTIYRPDREYIEGELLERNVGEWDHSRLQFLLARYIGNREDQWGILVVTEQRVQVKPKRFRIPDLTVVLGPRPKTGIVTDPPFLCVEILSRDDRWTEMRERVQDYIDFGVPNVWVIDPETRLANVFTKEGSREIHDGILTTENPDIAVNLAELD